MGTTAGRVRSENQDRAVTASFVTSDPKDSFHLLAVCDGLGGMQEGGTCASLALASTIAGLLNRGRGFDRAANLQAAVSSANEEVYRAFRERGGTTMAAVLMNRTGATAIAVGDTRIYRVEHDGGLTQLTRDDTIAQHVANLGGDVGRGENEPAPDQELAQFVGQAGALRPQIIDLRSLLGSDRVRDSSSSPRSVLITTDGIHRMAKSSLAALVRYGTTPRITMTRLIHSSDWFGGVDNATGLLIGIAPYDDVVPRVWDTPGLYLRDPFGDLFLPFVARDISETVMRSRDSGAVSGDRAPTAEAVEPRGASRSKRRKQPAKKAKVKPKSKEELDMDQPELNIDIHQDTE